jgi:hypothetical protein
VSRFLCPLDRIRYDSFFQEIHYLKYFDFVYFVHRKTCLDREKHSAKSLRLVKTRFFVSRENGSLSVMEIDAQKGYFDDNRNCDMTVIDLTDEPNVSQICVY